MIKTNNIRMLIVLGVTSLLAILILQLLWLDKTIAIQETNVEIQNKEDSLNVEQFTQQVRVALRDVLEEISVETSDSSDLYGAVRQLRSNHFVVDINEELYPFYLETLLKREFYNQGLQEDFQYGIYDCFSDSIVYGNLIRYNQLNADNGISGYTQIDSVEQNKLPKLAWKKDGHYFTVFFPQITSQKIESQDDLFSPVFYILIIVCIVFFFFWFSVSLLLKQRKLSEVKNDFINNMTHELKTPIATIGLSSEMLMRQKNAENKDNVLRYAGIIYKENKRLENQVERVLNLAKMDREELELQKRSIFLHDLIQEVKDNFDFTQEEKGGEIKLKLAADNDQINADEVHISNVLFNLIDNAIKYCEQEPMITIVTKAVSNGVQLRISDNGIGIKSEDLGQIFDKFFRVHTGNRHDVKGFGLGLYYVKTIIEAHDGKISVNSKINEGSTFEIYLPRHKK